MLTGSGLAKSFGPRTLFSDVTLKLAAGRRIALVGGNGVGKTTLVNILLGEVEPDAGEVFAPKDLRIGYLPQELPGLTDGTVMDEVLAGSTHITALSDRLRELEELLATDAGDRVIEEYGELQSRFEQLGGYALEAEAHRVLAGLGFAPDAATRPVRELSGGWRMRVSLGRLLLAEPDVLILDEPTNHLDVDSIAWLEDRLATWSGALLFVSHDRDFIDNVATHVLELAVGTAHEYVGGFAEFVVQREERMAAIEAAARRQAREVAKVERFIDRFRYKATKARQVQSRIKTLQKLEKIEVPERRELAAKFAFPEPRRSARVVAELTDVAVGYDGGEPIVSNVSLVIERGRKVALVGPNGAGKTTLVRLLLGQLEPSAGTVEIGNNVDHAVFVQDQAEKLDLTRTVYQEFATAVPQPGNRNLRTVLGSFGFSGDAADRIVGDLSGGERTRLALGMLMANPVNLLVLDEPTNHLDLPSCDVLEDALRVYPGTVLLVTHDRYLVRSVADALVDVRDGRAVWHEGVDEEILHPSATASTALSSERAAGRHQAKPAKEQSRRDQPKPTAESRPPKATGAKKGGQKNELRKSLQSVERKWEKAEAEVARLQAVLADPTTYDNADLMQATVAEHDEAKEKAANLMSEWERLSEKLSR
ncbi:MAG: ABC-F family ATP-binding cassette domain-containing protein [Acidimicrobiales bacterium]|nr:ABC-F family ATP-binding cassette domain-containing protein [Acidimicrobiales bacterium]